MLDYSSLIVFVNRSHTTYKNGQSDIPDVVRTRPREHTRELLLVVVVKLQDFQLGRV